MKSVCIIGLGYIGLPTAALIANCGFQVYGVDCVRSIAEKINQGKIHIYEPELENFVGKAVRAGRLEAGVLPRQADVFIIAVPTPFKEAKKPDLQFVQSAIAEIAPYLKPGDLIVLESTSPVGTTEKMGEWVVQYRPDLKVPRYQETLREDGKSIYLAHCPERVLPGKIMKELSANDRIIGGVNAVSGEVAKKFYQSFIQGEIFVTDARTAELSKLAENSFRDVNIAFANELSMICSQFGIDVWELIQLANRHPRVQILQPGPGVGGHCIAVDPWFIVDSAPSRAKLIRTARVVNDSKSDFVLEQLLRRIEGMKSPAIACLGLSFKPDIDDLRESPAMRIVENLAQKEIGRLLVAEPHIQALPAKLQAYTNVAFVDFAQAIAKADAVLVLVDHKAFKSMDVSMMQGKIVIDTRGIFREANLHQEGTGCCGRSACAAG